MIDCFRFVWLLRWYQRDRPLPNPLARFLGCIDRVPPRRAQNVDAEQPGPSQPLITPNQSEDEDDDAGGAGEGAANTARDRLPTYLPNNDRSRRSTAGIHINPDCSGGCDKSAKPTKGKGKGKNGGGK